MWDRKLLYISVVFTSFISFGYGCQIVNHNWDFPIAVNINDTFPIGDIVVSGETTGIEGIVTVDYGPETRGGPYFEVTFQDSQFYVRPIDAFARYEEIEVTAREHVIIHFRCEGGNVQILTIWVDINDTNNNAPEFIPSSELEFVVTPPLPPGYLVTGCLNSAITVRDIDLTTYRIDFAIEDNQYFEIAYDAAASTAEKQFVAQLRTKTFIRSINEPFELSITATDVDLTGDPQLTTTGIVRIVADAEFQFPEELVFYETFYLANYTDDHQLNLLETISLRQGFDEYVNFSLEGELSEYFDLRGGDVNQISVVVDTHLPSEFWSQSQILLIVRAERELTSGASTTVIVQLPEDIELQFERAVHEGVITNNELQLAPLVLKQGYEDVTVTAVTVGDLSSYFTASVDADLVTVRMAPLSNDVIDNNSFISLQVVASSDRSSASTVVNLEIIKDDTNTPVFDKSIYNGRYDPATGLNLEEIVFIQGFDDTVTVNLTEEYAHYFQIVEIGSVMTIRANIPPEMFSRQNILINIEASKPRTVGANAAIHVALPAARELEFEESTYRGSIEGGLLSLQTILLDQGYEDGVDFSLSGEYYTYFTVTNEQGLVTIDLPDALPDTAITQNSVIMLTLTASGFNAVTTTTSVLLDIIKDDTTTPVFSKSIYYGRYSGGEIEIEPINLSQGFDSSVSFKLDGEHAQYFRVDNNNVNNAVITQELEIPEDLIFDEKVLLFNVLADKALTVGANAAILIKFPSELTDSAIMRFSQNTYIGTFEENEVRVEDIVLDTGFAPGTQFIMSGDNADHFSWSITNNVVQISRLHTLPDEVIENNDIIVIEIEARRSRAVSVWTSVVVNVVKQEVIAPVFGQAYYIGSYTEETGLTFEETINLLEGYDTTVTFALIGEPEAWFSIEQEGSSLTLVSHLPVPTDVLESNNQLLLTIVANKPNAPSGRAVISLDLPKDFSDSSFRFQQDFYKGNLENGNLYLNEIILGDYTTDVNYTYTGDSVDYFQLRNQEGTFTITLDSSIPDEILEETSVFVLTLEAQNTNIRTHTVIIIENIKPQIENQHIDFEKPYYIGTYSSIENLQFDNEIRLASETDEIIIFDTEGDDAEWFSLVQNANSVTVTLSSPIPASVISNRHQLVFVVTAQSPGSATARATVVISLVDSFPEGSDMLGFDRVTYLGSIENNQANIPTITLREGFRDDVHFALQGELESHFIVTWQGPVVTISLRGAIPENLIPANRIIVLQIQASAPESVTTHATIVIEYIGEDEIRPVVELIFAQTFYDGSYAAATGLAFPIPLSLSQGYDSNVDFGLEGDDAEWFELAQVDNSVSVTLTSPIPAPVIANRQQLFFVVTAQSPDSATARATVVISLVDSFPEGSDMLGFDRVTYLGSIENNQANIPTITLREGFRDDVHFALQGELESHFIVTWQGPVVTVSLRGAIPENLIPANRIIVLQIQASAPESVTTHATIVIEYIGEDEIRPVVELIFAQTFYDGSYAAATGLAFPIPLSLSQGYDSNVDFGLEGDDAEWFELAQVDNSVSVTLTSPIPAPVIANRQQLVFVVTAQSPDSATARATVVISLVDSFPEGSDMLGFDRVTYLGSIENNQANIPTITLREGFRDDVHFALQGELKSHFIVTWQGPVVTISLRGAIPENLIPANRIIVLQIQASAPESVTTHATIVIEYIGEDEIRPVVELIFAQTFYDGSYAAATGLAFPIPLSLSQGYDSNVDFGLEGDDAEWFELAQVDNSVSVTLTSPIPAPVIANRQQLVFVVTAQSPDSATARATVVISLVDSFPEGSDMLGFDRVTYLGSIENNQANIPTITLREGFRDDVHFALQGELESHFIVTWQGPVVTVSLRGAIPENLIPANRIIVLQIQASAPESVTTHATIVIEYIGEDEIRPVVELIFAQTFYDGSYAAATGLAFPIPLSLSQGYDSNVDFGLEGDDAEWFELAQVDNSVSVTLTSPIPAPVIANRQQLVFVVTAQSPDSATARATVVISLVDSFPEGSDMLGFDRVTYLGSIENNQANIPTITLREGFRDDVHFALQGELESHFIVTWQGPVVTVSLRGAIPENLIPANRIIVLQIQASAPESVTTHATIVIEYIGEDEIRPVVELIFAQTFYDGSYAAATGLAFPIPLSLSQGYDSNVDFGLEGDDAEWFELAQVDNSVSVTLTSPIPAPVIANRQQLVFVVTAQSPDSATARATVVISLVDSFPEGSDMLGFDRVTYLGSIENNQANIPTITLREGFRDDVHFALQGELESHFIVTWQGPVVTVSLRSVIPENLIPANRIIVLQIQASAPESVTTHATIVIENIGEDEIRPVVELIFAQTFYDGSYAAATGLAFPIPLSLSQGYDSNVDFGLEGDDAEWFELAQVDNSVSVTLTSPIPAPVIANRQQLVFVVTAQSPDSATARATVVISLVDSFPEGSDMLGFDRVTYLGSIENNQANIPTITLREGFRDDVHFALQGELESHFIVTWQGPVVTVSLRGAIPENLIPANRIIVLQIQASAPESVTTHATIVIEYIGEDEIRPVVELIFAQTFYDGSYAAATGLAFPIPLSLSQGYDSNVDFGLEGDDAEWFELAQVDNSVSVTLTSPIPAPVIANRQQLVFVVTAQSPDSATARATVVISLVDSFPEGSDMLGFDRVTYLGSIENNQANIPTITLREGFRDDVHFALQGELESHFIVTWQGPVVTVSLRSVIPENLIPANRIIVLQIQASAPESVTTHATIVIEYIGEDEIRPVVELIFAQTFYDGSYAAATGLSFPIPLSLSQGYDSNVDFGLEGDDAEWFELAQVDNSVSVTLTSPIPAPVIANRQQLVFVVTAQSPGSATARATVVISLVDSFPEGSDMLGFDRVTYLGSIENNQANIPTITLREGFRDDVHFALQGELESHFIVTWQGPVVTISLRGAIPENLIPANRIIVLQIQASAPESVTTHATIVIEYIGEDEIRPVVELIFAQTFYDGSYAAATGLAFPIPLSLSQGYDSNVDFGLEGDDAEWFELAQVDNSVSVSLTSPIPAPVIANRQQLVFVVTAQSPDSATARATVVISLVDSFPEGSDMLGFDRVTYLGSIENNQANIPTITLREGFRDDVHFALQGELESHFIVTWQGPVVTVSLRSVIPENLIPANRIIVLQIQASAPESVTTHATIVIEYIGEDEIRPVVELIFAQTFYDGSYAAATGLAFPIPLSLSQGYDSNVDFGLEGDDAEWFELAQVDNSVSVTLTSPIPAPVIANRQQLVFVVTAQSPDSATARATVVISLVDSFPEGSDMLGFDRVTYLGSIENNQANIPTITLREGFRDDVHFALQGELESHFIVTWQGPVVTVSLRGAIPENLIPANRIIVLQIQASAPESVTTHATIVIEYIGEDEIRPVVELIFAQTFYDGSYAAATGLAFPIPLSLSQGYDSNVDFGLEGDDAEWFELAQVDNSVSVTLTSPIPAPVIANRQQLVFVVTAQSPDSATARATVVISLVDSFPEGSDMLGFDRVTYLGSIENNQANIPTITLREGFRDDVHFALQGELESHFIVTWQGPVVTVSLRSVIPENLIPANRIIVLQIQASAPESVTTHATIVIEYIGEDEIRPVVELIFAQTFYDGSYAAATGLAFPIPLSLSQGYDSNVDFGLEGDDAEWFELAQVDNSVSVTLTSPIPAAVTANRQQLVFVVTAQSPGSATARATVIISIENDLQPGPDVTFDKVLYEGIVRDENVDHETITVIGFTGSTVELHGEYSPSFAAVLSNDRVTVSASSSFILPSGITHVALELHAGTASTVLVLSVVQTGGPATPSVTFTSPSYAVRIDISQTGLVGQVQASADNGEAVIYSMELENAHLRERLSINDEGALHLSAPLNTGSYTFEVIATTRFTQARGTAVVHLTVEEGGVAICGNGVDPLIILDVDEEEPHHDLISGAQPDGCHYTLANRWPLDQTWVYVDASGLHTTAIDREHESIAFMALSQVQVEITLHCESDSTRTKRSLASDALGPYDYGSNKWILTDTIPFDSRRSLVNIIVNDINDNAPIFVDKQNEPIAVGYPVPELAERVLPRSLAELQATDADIGENAALLYWSAAPQLAVAPTTGFVHLRDGATLENGARLTVSATDRNGEGLTGTIDILVRLLDESYIAVVTIRDAFLDNEVSVVSSLSAAVGYEIKVLRAVVISDEVDSASRKKRDLTSAAGASLQLYVYGLIAREPVAAEQLTADISNIVTAPVTVASSVSLQDHLEGQEICVIAGRDTGLLVSTIILSVLLFIVLVVIAVWFFLRWKKNRNYDEFSDDRSLASRNASEDKFPKPEVLPKPRLDIAELKKSERRLQEMLDAPVPDISVEPTSSRNDAIINMSEPMTAVSRNDAIVKMPEPLVPIVIQSIDKLKDAADESSDDEFGEIKTPRRKSVVTFNENVEKIIHVEDTPDGEDVSTIPDYEVYKL